MGSEMCIRDSHSLTLGFHQAFRLLDQEDATRRARASFDRLVDCSRR